jgi:hypothetical protein
LSSEWFISTYFGSSAGEVETAFLFDEAASGGMMGAATYRPTLHTFFNTNGVLKAWNTDTWRVVTTKEAYQYSPLRVS